MDEQLKIALGLVHEQGQQIISMMKLIESHIAIREAHTTILQAMMPLVTERPEFQEALDKVHRVRLAHHLTQDVSNTFIANYQKTVNSLLPEHLRFPDDGALGKKFTLD